MKKLTLLLLFVPLVSLGQEYSTYYGTNDININANVNINKNVNVSGVINKTITTIDYGALLLANAQKEKNRINAQIYADEKQRKQALEIAINPIKAFDYGKDNSWVMDRKSAHSRGFSKGIIWYHKIPNEFLFEKMNGYNYRNVSEEGVTTIFMLGEIFWQMGTTQQKKLPFEEQKQWLVQYGQYWGNTEKYLKDVLEGKIYLYPPPREFDFFSRTLKSQEGIKPKSFYGGNYIHKTDLNRATVYGNQGYVVSYFYEDDYEIVIEDNYKYWSPNGVEISTGVIYKGDKDEVDFEIIEGRRRYLKRLIEKTIATSKITLGKRGFNN